MESYQQKTFFSFLFLFIASISYLIYGYLFFGSWEVLATKAVLTPLLFAGVLSVFSSFFLITKGFLWREKFLWKYVICTSFLLVFLILGLIFIDYYSSKEYLFSDFKVMHTQQDVDTFVPTQEEKIIAGGAQPPLKIPTGCLLHHIEFDSKGELRIIGYVWQLFNKETFLSVFIKLKSFNLFFHDV